MSPSPRRPFAIIGTPRSRTAWLARFLSHGGVRCDHEPSRFWAHDNDIHTFFRPDVGAVDSMLTFKWRALDAAGVRLIAVTRPIDDVLMCCKRAGLPVTTATIRLLERVTAIVASLPSSVPRFEFAQLDYACVDIFKLCHGVPCPRVWRGIWRHRHVEVDFWTTTLPDVAANAAGIAQFYNL